MSLTDLPDLTPAEKRLLEQCHLPERITFGDGSLPEAATPDTRIRASLLRNLLLDQGEKRLNAKGLRLRGAVICGPLDLQGTDTTRDLTLASCRVESALNLLNAGLRGLHLSGCVTQTITADNAHFTGSVYLRGDTKVDGEVSLAGARIAGDLQICGATLNPKGPDAVFAPSLRVEGSVFLGNYPYADGETELHARGMVFLASARIAHDLFITNTALSTAEQPLPTAIFGATEEHGSEIALSLARAQVGGILYLQRNQISSGVVNLAGASVARLTDEPAGPGANYPIRLDGFQYGDFSRHTDTSVRARIDWLERRPAGLPFVAQPYEHLANVLTTLGHRTDAQTVLMRKERLLRAENRRLASGAARRAAMFVRDGVLNWSIGYGYRPGRAVMFAVLLIAGLAVFYQKVWDAGDFAPNAAPILVSRDWISATQSHPENPAMFWTAKDQAGQDFETFSAVAYAADLVVPLISLGQEDAWAPSTSRSPLGWFGWWLRWVAKTLGWIVTALAAAALTGIIRKD